MGSGRGQMADEPANPSARMSDAHDAMEGQPDPSCFSLSESGVSMRNGTTESFCVFRVSAGVVRIVGTCGVLDLQTWCH